MLVHRPACVAPSGDRPLPRVPACILAAVLALSFLQPAAQAWPQTTAATTASIAGNSRDSLPDEPLPEADRLPWPDPPLALPSTTIAPPSEAIPLQDCPFDQTHARECRVHWRQLFISSTVFITWQNAANLYSGYWYRYETTHGDWAARYAASVTGYRFSVWADGNPLLDDYVGHPLMGAITNALWIQNDPKGMTLAFSNTRPYWKSRLRAFEYSTVYSTEWKLGPIGESGVGHQGDHLAAENGGLRNETGFVSLVTTPVGGTLWTITEDILDEKLIQSLEQRSSNPFLLTTYQFLNPARAAGNLLRFRPPWYRDSRNVRASSFWSDPEPTADTALSQYPPAPDPSPSPFPSSSDPAGISSSNPDATTSASLDPAHPPEAAEASPSYVLRPAPPAASPLPGGTHELGAWWGLSLFSGPLWGYEKDVKYMPIDVRYSYRFLLHSHWALRYSPELTALAMIDWPTPNGSAPLNLRKRVYGSGLSPEGLQLGLLPRRHVQPFLSHDGGFLYFADRVLSPQGSRFMYTVDFGAGVNIFRKGRQAITLGYRYQHLSNANISQHNPGTDANTFYVGVSRFRSRASASR